ncbi:mRNA export factor GLE1 [Nakaseomyces bracarensis]|uniref:mRNA export factor GLE1 n=1 Tax=Nakaseomyces bracarensis TaxID=273131 RepID=A0ABR4NQ08_9SACH
MRFVLDELYSEDEDSSMDLKSLSSSSSGPVEYTIVNESDDEYIPSLKLPKQKIVVNRPERQEIQEELPAHLQKLLESDEFKKGIIEQDTVPHVLGSLRDQKNKSDDDNDKLLEITSMPKDNLKVDMQEIEQQFTNLLLNKFKSVENENMKLVKSIRDERKRVEEEKKRLEEERRRKEEEERKRREEEERKRKEEEEMKKKQLLEADLKKKKEAEEKLKQEQEQKEKEKALQKQKEQEKEKAKSATTNFDDIAKTFWKYKAKIKSIKDEIVLPVKSADKQIRNILSKHKRKINPKFGQLTNTFSQLVSIQNELSHLIDQTKEDQLSYLWILNFIAKAIVHQAETEVRAKPEASVPLARLTLYLMVRYPEFNELLMARFVKKCPFVIGFTCNIDTEEGRSNMGWKRDSGGKWEEPTSYNERIGSMATLYSVITRLQLPPEFIQTSQHPLPISHSWQLVARIANTPLNLIQDTHFVVLGSWWDAAAKEFLQAYGAQAGKLLMLIGDSLTSAVAERKYVGAARLRILLEAWQNNTIDCFPEMVP